MSLTNDDIQSIETIVTKIVNNTVEASERRLRGDIKASEHNVISSLMAHGDLRHEQASVQMEDGFTHLQKQFRKFASS